MALPERITVKLSSEAGGAVVMTPVVTQELPLTELLERMLWAFGKDVERARDLLRRGSLVSGASRFRWSPMEASLEEIRAVFGQFPDPEPWRVFEARQCVKIRLRNHGRQLEIEREAGCRKRLFQRHSFWELVLKTAVHPAYADYSYRDRADRFVAELDATQGRTIREAARLLRYSKLEEAVAAMPLRTVELFTVR